MDLLGVIDPESRRRLVLVSLEFQLIDGCFPHIISRDETLGPAAPPADVQKRALGTVTVKSQGENGDLCVVCVGNHFM
jgi:hypothetical protein